MKTALGNFGFLVLVGVGTLFLIGPVMALISVAASVFITVLSAIVGLASILVVFALVGLLIYLPCREMGKMISAYWGEAARQTVADPVSRGWLTEWRKVREGSVTAWARCRGIGPVVGGVALETVCGAVVLGVLAALVSADLRPSQQEVNVVCGVLLGTLFGFLIGLVNYTSAHHILGSRH